MHTYQNQIFGLGSDIIQSFSLSFPYVQRVFATFKPQIQLPGFPCFDDVKVLFIVFPIGKKPLRLTPTNFVKPGQCLVWQPQIQKWLHRLHCPSQGRSVNFLKRSVFVSIKKCSSLSVSLFAKFGIDFPSLDYPTMVVPRLAMTYQINFFTFQFYIYLAAKK